MGPSLGGRQDILVGVTNPKNTKERKDSVFYGFIMSPELTIKPTFTVGDQTFASKKEAKKFLLKKLKTQQISQKIGGLLVGQGWEGVPAMCRMPYGTSERILRWSADEIAESILKAPYLWSDLLHIAQPDKFPSLKMFEESINQERINQAIAEQPSEKGAD